MANFTIDIEPKTYTCCRCGRVENCLPMVLTFDHDYARRLDGTPSVRKWIVTSWQNPAGWRMVGGDDLCPSCWETFVAFVAAGKDG